MRLLWLIIVCCFVQVTATFGQGSIFGLHAVLGANAGQIRGDELAGFDKVGIHGGLRGTVELQEKLGLSLELLYSVRGSRPSIFNDVIDPDINITLKYLDIPVYLTYSDWYDQEGDYDKAFALAGFSYGRLIDSSTYDDFNMDEQDIDLLAQYFNNNDFSWLLGFGFRLSKHFIISMRYTRSITLLLNSKKLELDANPLRVFFLTFRGEYVF